MKPLAAILFAVLLTACGGGHQTSVAKSPDPPPVTPAPPPEKQTQYLNASTATLTTFERQSAGPWTLSASLNTPGSIRVWLNYSCLLADCGDWQQVPNLVVGQTTSIFTVDPNCISSCFTGSAFREYACGPSGVDSCDERLSNVHMTLAGTVTDLFSWCDVDPSLDCASQHATILVGPVISMESDSTKYVIDPDEVWKIEAELQNGVPVHAFVVPEVLP